MRVSITANVSSSRSYDDKSATVNFGDETNALDVRADEMSVSLSPTEQLEAMTNEDLTDLAARLGFVSQVVSGTATVNAGAAAIVGSSVAATNFPGLVTAVSRLGLLAAPISLGLAAVAALNNREMENVDAVLENRGFSRDQ